MRVGLLFFLFAGPGTSFANSVIHAVGTTLGKSPAAVKESVFGPPPLCTDDDLKDVYAETLRKIEKLPLLPAPKFDWPKLYEEMQVKDYTNQLSCTGHSVARALFLTNLSKGGRAPMPSPEFLYDRGAAYFSLFKEGKIPSPARPLPNVSRIEAAERSKLIEERVTADAAAAKKAGWAFPGSSTVLVLDYASHNPVALRDVYAKHFTPWDAQKQKAAPKVQFVDFPPLAQTLRGKAIRCFEDENGKRLTPASVFKDTKDRLAQFDFRLVDTSLERGYFPILDINSDASELEDNGFVSYKPGGGIGHSLVVVGKDPNGEFYEVLDSWADEKAKAKDPKYVMKTYKIRKADLEKKMIHFSVLY